jgi:signal transduction histidine kinase
MLERLTLPEVLRPQTYLRLAYLLLGLPMAMLYVIPLLLGLLIGTPLFLIGSPLLLQMVLQVWNAAQLERKLALKLTGVAIPTPREDQFLSTSARVRALLERAIFWKSLLFLICKLPLGLATTAASLMAWFLSLLVLTAPIHRSSMFNMEFVEGGPPALIIFLIGGVLVLIAVRLTNLIAPKVAEIACFALTDTSFEPWSNQQRFEALALASRAASLAHGVGGSKNLDAILETILQRTTGALQANAGALLLESRRFSLGFANDELERALDVEASQWRPTAFGRGTLLPLAHLETTVTASLVMIPFGNRSHLIVRFDHDQPRRSDLEFLATIADQIAVALENARLIALAQGQAALEERHKLARDLHDSVSQALYGIALGARTAKAQLERDPQLAHEPLDYVLQLAEAGVTEMRALIFELRPEHLERDGLVAALQQQAEMMRLRYHLETETQFDPEPDWSLEVKQALLRIAQEALHNTVKHAQATRAHLSLRGRTLEIGDDGVGFKADQRFEDRYGQRTMRERAEVIRAQFDLETATGQGTRIRVTLPMD